MIFLLFLEVRVAAKYEKPVPKCLAVILDYHQLSGFAGDVLVKVVPWLGPELLHRVIEEHVTE